MWGSVIHAFGWCYEHWGTLSQLIVGLFAFTLSILPHSVAELEKKLRWKIGLPILVGTIAITGYVVSESSDAELKSQLSTMFNQVRLEATKDDIGILVTHINDGFKSVVDAIATLCKPSHKPPKSSQITAQPALPAPPHVSITQARALSTDPQFKFALQVTVQSDQQMPASFVFECSGEVGKVDAFIVGRGVGMDVVLGTQSPTVALVHFGYPPLTPQAPLVVTILSKDDIRLNAVKPY